MQIFLGGQWKYSKINWGNICMWTHYVNIMKAIELYTFGKFILIKLLRKKKNASTTLILPELTDNSLHDSVPGRVQRIFNSLKH